MAVETILGEYLAIAPQGYCSSNGGPFGRLFSKTQRLTGGESLEGISCLLLLGGEDVHPSFYEEKPGNHTHVGGTPSMRDRWEWGAMKWCIAKGIPIIGLCRGAQFATIAAGGKLVQHVEGHGGSDHDIVTKDGEILKTNSLHHQMMFPYYPNVPHELIAWSKPPRSTVYLDGDNKQIKLMESKDEPEIVFYPHIKTLAIQGHPEYLNAPVEFQKLCVRLVKEYLF